MSLGMSQLSTTWVSGQQWPATYLNRWSECPTHPKYQLAAAILRVVSIVDWRQVTSIQWSTMGMVWLRANRPWSRSILITGYLLKSPRLGQDSHIWSHLIYLSIHSSREADWSIGLVLAVTDFTIATPQCSWYLPKSHFNWAGRYNSTSQ